MVAGSLPLPQSSPLFFIRQAVALVETGFGCNVAVLEPGLFAYVIIVEAASARTTAIVVSVLGVLHVIVAQRAGLELLESRPTSVSPLLLLGLTGYLLILDTICSKVKSIEY